jgi:cell division protein FtsN
MTPRVATAAPRIIAPPSSLKPTIKPVGSIKKSGSTAPTSTVAKMTAKPTPAVMPTMKPAVQAAALNSPVKQKKTATPAEAETHAGGFLLQIGSYKSEAEASVSWQAYKAAHPAVSGYSPDIHRAELGAKGTWYRLRVGPFASLSEANAACAKVKASGGNCFPAKR